MKNVTVVGLGKIGLPLAAVFANSGYYQVYGADVNQSVVNIVNAGKSHIKNEPGLDELVENAHKKGTLQATVNTSDAVSKSDIVIVIVPVLINEAGDTFYEYIDSAVSEIAKGIKKNTLIIFETTLPTGDTKNRFGKKIEEVSGFKMGKDLHIAYSPERVYSNRIIQDLASYPKIVGGINKESLDLATEFYEQALNCEVLQVSNLETAEFTKVAESVYRDVNIALVNELAIYADKLGVNIKEVIQAGNSEPFCNLHSPGIGVGGHCIPIYPYFFINNGLQEGLVTQSRTINDQMAEYAVKQAENIIGSLKNQNILILGLSFRENVKEITKSSTLLVLNELTSRSANVYIDDPLYTDEEISKYGGIPFSDKIKGDIDVIFLQAYHDQYKHINFKEYSGCKLVLDGRNVLNQKSIEELGIIYKGIGI